MCGDRPTVTPSNQNESENATLSNIPRTGLPSTSVNMEIIDAFIRNYRRIKFDQSLKLAMLLFPKVVSH